MSTHIILDPSEIRSVTRETGGARRRAIVLAFQIGLGVACVAGVFAGASAMLSGLDNRDSDIRLGSIENWPEIKDGVPEVVRRKATVSGPLVGSSTAPTVKIEAPIARELPGLNAAPRSAFAITRELPKTTAETATAEASDEHAGADPVLAQLRSAVPLPPVELDPGALAAEVVAGAPAAIAIERRDNDPGSTSAGAEEPSTMQASLVSSGPDGQGAAPHPLQATAPVPPRRPRGLGGEPRPKKVARVEGSDTGAPSEPLPEQASAESAKPAEDERVHLFGMPLPSFIPNGRKIRDCVLEFRC
jgi:hypothetical protein